MSEMFPPPLLMGNFLWGEMEKSSHLVLWRLQTQSQHQEKSNMNTKKKNNLRERAEESCLGWESSLRKWSISRRAITWASPCIDKAFFFFCCVFFFFLFGCTRLVTSTNPRRWGASRTASPTRLQRQERAAIFAPPLSLSALPFKLHVLLLFLFSRSCTAGITQSVDERRFLLVQCIISLFGLFVYLNSPGRYIQEKLLLLLDSWVLVSYSFNMVITVLVDITKFAGKFVFSLPYIAT